MQKLIALTAILASTVFGSVLHSHSHDHGSAACSAGSACCSSSGSATVKNGPRDRSATPSPYVSRSSFCCSNGACSASGQTHQNCAGSKNVGDSSEERPPWQPHRHDCGICLVLAQSAVSVTLCQPVQQPEFVAVVGSEDECAGEQSSCQPVARGPPLLGAVA